MLTTLITLTKALKIVFQMLSDIAFGISEMLETLRNWRDQ